MKEARRCYECRYFLRTEAWSGECVNPDFKANKFRFSSSPACELFEPVNSHDLEENQNRRKEGEMQQHNNQNNQNQTGKEVVMQEAPISFNVKFNYKGFDSQVTIRGEDLKEVSKKFLQVVEGLEKIGATPERRWEAVKNGSGANGKEPKSEEAKPCRKCGGMNLKLIKWNKNGKQMQAYKCLDCGTWQ